jgi:hypothetical protein
LSTRAFGCGPNADKSVDGAVIPDLRRVRCRRLAGREDDRTGQRRTGGQHHGEAVDIAAVERDRLHANCGVSLSPLLARRM